MKGVKLDCKTGKIEQVDDGLPLPSITPAEPETVNLSELKKLLNYAKAQNWI